MKIVKLLEHLSAAGKDFEKKFRFYPRAFILSPRAWRALRKRTLHGAAIRPDDRVKAGEFVVMCGRAYETWKFQHQVRDRRRLWPRIPGKRS